MTTDNQSRRIIILTFLFFVTFVCFAPLTIAAPTAPQKYTYGFKLYQYNLEPGDSVADNPIPKAELGSFVAKKSEFTYREVEKIIGIPINTARLYRAMGYLNVKEPGSYTIITTSKGHSKYGCIFVNKKLAISNRNSPFVVTAPVYFSEPGCYEVDIRIYDFINRDLVVPMDILTHPMQHLIFLLKHPIMTVLNLHIKSSCFLYGSLAMLSRQRIFEKYENRFFQKTAQYSLFVCFFDSP